MRDDMAEILKFAGRVTASRLFLSTNGTRLTKEFIQAVLPLRHRLTLKFSLDGPEAVHDGIRGLPGAHQAVMAALALCQTAGLTVELTTTIMRTNIQYLPELMETVLGLPCRRHHFVELIPVGRADLDLCPRLEERIQAKRWFRHYQPQYELAGKKLKWRLPFLDGSQVPKCNGGISECGITSDGSVTGCRLMPEFSAGNILKRPFLDIWNDPKGFAIFRDPMDKLGAVCSYCAVRTRCHGGCRAYTMGVTGDPLRIDPRCSGAVAIDCR